MPQRASTSSLPSGPSRTIGAPYREPGSGARLPVWSIMARGGVGGAGKTEGQPHASPAELATDTLGQSVQLF